MVYAYKGKYFTTPFYYIGTNKISVLNNCTSEQAYNKEDFSLLYFFLVYSFPRSFL